MITSSSSDTHAALPSASRASEQKPGYGFAALAERLISVRLHRAVEPGQPYKMSVVTMQRGENGMEITRETKPVSVVASDSAMITFAVADRGTVALESDSWDLPWDDRGILFVLGETEPFQREVVAGQGARSRPDGLASKTMSFAFSGEGELTTISKNGKLNASVKFLPGEISTSMYYLTLRLPAGMSGKVDFVGVKFDDRDGAQKEQASFSM